LSLLHLSHIALESLARRRASSPDFLSHRSIFWRDPLEEFLSFRAEGAHEAANPLVN
jgi:hypothetical protein